MFDLKSAVETVQQQVRMMQEASKPEPCPGCGNPAGPCPNCECVRTDDRD